MTFESMGNLNKGWGICGFTSCFYALYEDLAGTPTHARIINGSMAFNVLAEIKTYLRILQAEGRLSDIQDIETFCQSFGGVYAKFTVADYCKKISDAVRYSDAEVLKEDFSIGLPPTTVKDYLTRIWGMDSKVYRGSDPGGQSIIGMTHKGSSTGCDGLVHYMYRARNGKIYSWGHPPYTTIEDAANGGAPRRKGWQIGWVITLK